MLELETLESRDTPSITLVGTTVHVVLADPLDTVFGFDLAEDTFIDPVP